MKKLNIDNPFFEVMGNIADLVFLNVIFVITCLPVITIGTAQTSLYRVMLRRARGECAYPVQEYFDVFKQEWKQSMKLWVIFLLTGGVLVFDIMYLGQNWSILGIMITILLCIWMMMFSYAFPLQAQFDNSIKNTLQNALFMSIRHLPYTVLIIILNVLPVLSLLIGTAIFQLIAPIFLAIGFSVIAMLNTKMFQKIFKNYIE